jgi:hypothetical protein
MRHTLAIVATALGVAAVTTLAVDLTWNPPPASDQVQRTFVQVMDLPSSNVTTFSTTNPVITVPGGVSDRRFRLAHSNVFGLSEWTPWVATPAEVAGIKVSFPLAQ